MKSSTRVLLAMLWLGIASAAAASAAEPAGASPQAKRPKICVVLSGGGARGAAHVGVLKTLEKYRVPVDCIAGTSMGALVGAAYASGVSVAEMENILAGISTELLFKEKPPRQEQSMRRKQDDYRIFVTPELGVAGGELGIAKGVVSGVQLETVLRKLARTKGYLRFDALPIPFRAVATDLVTGKAVVFDEGELANVMRASMSVPGAVAPAEFGGMVLVDGMLTSNLPVAIARAMGADIVIAVNVGTPLLEREELNGVVGIMGQMLNILTEQNVQVAIASLTPRDILITPELGTFSTGDFDHLPKIAPHGEQAAEAVADRLAPLSLDGAEYAALRIRQQIAVPADERPVDEIRFATMRHVNPQSLAAIMETRTGQRVDQDTLDRDMVRVYGTGDFEHVNYRFLEEAGRRILVVDAVEKTWGRDTLRLGIGLSAELGGDSNFNLLARYRKGWINPLGGEWRTELQLGRTSALRTEFYQPLSLVGGLFVSPSLALERRSTPVYDGQQRVAVYDISSSQAGLDVGSLLGRYGEVRLGIVVGALKPRLDTGPPSLSPGDQSIGAGAVTLRAVLDQLNSVSFPRSGWRAGLKLYRSTAQLGADDEYFKWDVDGTAAASFGEHTFSVSAKLGGRYGADPLPRYDLFQWGGFLQMSGYRTGQFAGGNLQYLRAMYYRRVLRGSLFEGAYGGVSLETGRMRQALVPGSPEGWLRSGSVFVGLDTVIGPTYLGYGLASDGTSQVYFYVGRPF